MGVGAGASAGSDGGNVHVGGCWAAKKNDRCRPATSEKGPRRALKPSAAVRACRPDTALGIVPSSE
ncbi:DUF6233 domain-containing protein [Streptomyces sp. NPDC004457]